MKKKGFKVVIFHKNTKYLVRDYSLAKKTTNHKSILRIIKKYSSTVFWMQMNPLYYLLRRQVIWDKYKNILMRSIHPGILQGFIYRTKNITILRNIWNYKKIDSSYFLLQNKILPTEIVDYIAEHFINSFDKKLYTSHSLIFPGLLSHSKLSSELLDKLIKLNFGFEPYGMKYVLFYDKDINIKYYLDFFAKEKNLEAVESIVDSRPQMRNYLSNNLEFREYLQNESILGNKSAENLIKYVQ